MSSKKKKLTFDDPEDSYEENKIKVVNTVFKKTYDSMSAEKFKSLVELIVNKESYVKNDFMYVLVSTQYYDTKIEKYLPEEEKTIDEKIVKKGRTTKAAKKTNEISQKHDCIATKSAPMRNLKPGAENPKDLPVKTHTS